MALEGTDLAILSARLGVARIGASRLGFYPCDVESTGTAEPGEYVWKEMELPETQWELVVGCPSKICGERPTAGFTMSDETPTPTYDPPVAGFTWAGPAHPPLYDVDFTDTSTGVITSWAWDFGDLSTDTLQSPSHTYSGEGPWTVTLTVTGPGGSDDETQIVFMGS